MKVHVYSDGSSHARSGLPGGWGFVVEADGAEVLRGSGAHPSTSNNRMELMGAIEGLKAAGLWLVGKGIDDALVELTSDSQYVVGLANRASSPTVNLDLVERLQKFMGVLGAQATWVKGHAGHPQNEACDQLAHAAKVRMVSDLKSLGVKKVKCQCPTCGNRH